MFRRAIPLVLCVFALHASAAEREPGVAFAVAIERGDVDAVYKAAK